MNIETQCHKYCRGNREKRVVFSCIAICVLILSMFGCAAQKVQSLENNVQSSTLPPDISGVVLINVFEEYGRSGFLEYTLSLPDGVLKESDKGKEGVAVVHPVRFPMLSSERFARAYEAERLYLNSMGSKLEANFSQGNMEYYDRLLVALQTQDINSLKKHPSTRFIDNVLYPRKHLERFRPNRQFTHVIFISRGSGDYGGLLIDLEKKEITFPFRKDLLRECEWDKSGQRIAYSTAKGQFEEHSILVVKDISSELNRHRNLRSQQYYPLFRNLLDEYTLFRLELGKRSVVDITWAPDGRYVAVLSASFTYSYNPFALLVTFSGHPVGYRTYYLELYDMAGKLLYQSKEKDIGTFSAGRGSGLGALVWLEKGT